MATSRFQKSRAVILLGILSGMGVWVFAARREKLDFPDYSRLEYAKPLPPPDQQIKAPPPGSINMIVGEKKKIVEGTTLDAVPVSLLRRDATPDESEPSMFDILEQTPPAVASTTTLPAPAK